MATERVTAWLAGLRQAVRGRYVRLLEAQIERERAEIERLRAENRALLNSLLGTGGFPPVEARPLHPAQIAPLRRRSWQQIAATQEIEAMRREANARKQETKS